jgi:hypothetical protein
MDHFLDFKTYVMNQESPTIKIGIFFSLAAENSNHFLVGPSIFRGEENKRLGPIREIKPKNSIRFEGMTQNLRLGLEDKKPRNSIVKKIRFIYLD